MADNFKSQFNQDKQVINFYNGLKDGFFIEIGAYDGIESSNTYALEMNYGWTGICVECNPRYFDKLIINRNCMKSNYAIYNDNNLDMEFYDSGGYAGLVETNNHKHIINDTKIKVKTKKLTTLLDEMNAPHFIHYLSLDTEGSEYNILKAHDFEKYKFGYICVEHNDIYSNRTAINILLESKGYKFVRENGNSQWGVVDDEYQLVDINSYLHHIPKENNRIETIPNVLFLNHKKSHCGVYSYGERLYNVWKNTKKYNFTYSEICSFEEYNNINFCDYKLIIYNYHFLTMNWLTENNINRKCINLALLHECNTNIFDYSIDTSIIPRPIFYEIPNAIISNDQNVKFFLNYGIECNIPIIGSFGFGFLNKGFNKIIEYVNEQFDEAIIKFIIPYSTYGCNLEIEQQLSQCNQITRKKGIKLMIINDFLDDNDILYFLNNNTVNMFLYDYMYNRGISSVIDYAISVNTPLCISNSYMFRHIYDDSICVYINSIQYCIKNSINYTKKFKELYSQKKLINFVETNILNIVK